MSPQPNKWEFLVKDDRVYAVWGDQQALMLSYRDNAGAMPLMFALKAVKPVGYPAPGVWRALDGTLAPARTQDIVQDAYDEWAATKAQERTRDEVRALAKLVQP